MNLNFFKKRNKFIHNNWNNSNPYKHWKYSLYFILLMFFVSMVFGWYFFNQNNKNINSMIEQEFISDFSVIDFNKIDETVVFFEEREQEVKNILESQINFTDPSI
jgi:hypothetical protein